MPCSRSARGGRWTLADGGDVPGAGVSAPARRVSIRARSAFSAARRFSTPTSLSARQSLRSRSRSEAVVGKYDLDGDAAHLVIVRVPG